MTNLYLARYYATCVTLYIQVFFFQAEDGIRAVLGSRGLGDVYKRQDYWGILAGSTEMVLPEKNQ